MLELFRTRDEKHVEIQENETANREATVTGLCTCGDLTISHPCC